MLDIMFTFFYGRPGLICRAMLASAPFFLSACTVMQRPVPAPQSPARASPPEAAAPSATPASVGPFATPSERPATGSAGAQNDVTPTPAGASTAPTSTLQSLPPALAALFQDPPIRYATPGLQDGRLDWSTAGEIDAWLRDLAAPSPASSAPTSPAASRRTAVKATLLSLPPPAGTASATETSARMQALHLSAPRKVTPATQATEPSAMGETAAPPAPPTVLLVGGRDHSAATEALLLVAHELARGKLRPLLTRINVVVVPHTGLGGQAESAPPDDHVALDSASAQILARLAQTQQATVVLSASEAPAMTRLGAQAALRTTDATLVHANNPNLPEFLTRAADEWFKQPMLAALKAEALRVDSKLLAEHKDLAMPDDGSGHDNIASAAALKNQIGLQVVTAGSDLGRAHVQRRVHAQVTAISSALTSTAKRSAELAELKPYLDREVTAQACRQPFLPQPAAPEHTRIKPCGYWLAAEADRAVERLRLHGIQVMRVAESASLLGDTYQTKPARQLDRAKAVPPFNLVRGVIDAPAGSFYVPVNQAQGNLVVATLEPDAPSSLTAPGLLDATTEVARVMSPPAVRLEALP